MHSSVVAHQCFALKALSWLGQVIQYSGMSALHYPQSLSVCVPCVVSVYMLCFRRAEEDPVSGRSAGSSGGRKLLTGRPADAQRLQDVER